MKTSAGNESSWLGALLACVLAGGGCMADPQDLSEPEAVTAQTQAVSNVPPVTPAMKYLADLPAEPYGELALGRLFAHGTATYVPTGVGTGYPVLFNSIPELNWLASQLWGGKTLRVTSSETHPNGDPIVRLDNKIIQTPTGALLDLFDAYVTRGKVADLDIGTNDRGQKVKPPFGILAPVSLSFLDESVVIDDQPSVILNYFDDRSLPIIRRVLDEIREVDGVHCKGLFIGRAHVRRCTSLGCGETPTVLIDFPERPTFETHYQWRFWTYFLLNFGQADGQCDIAEAIAQAEQDLVSQGLDARLPDAPPTH